MSPSGSVAGRMPVKQACPLWAFYPFILASCILSSFLTTAEPLAPMQAKRIGNTSLRDEPFEFVLGSGTVSLSGVYNGLKARMPLPQAALAACAAAQFRKRVPGHRLSTFSWLCRGCCAACQRAVLKRKLAAAGIPLPCMYA